MKTGILGPAGRVEKIRGVIRRDFPNIEPVPLIYDVFTEAPGIVKFQQPYLDALMIAGTMPYSLCRASVKPTIPWEFIPRKGSSLLRVLLETALLKNYDITNVSFDSFAEDELYEAYAEIGIARDRLHIFPGRVDPLDPGFLNYVLDFHRDTFRSGRVCCCLSAMESVYKALQADGIPSLLITPTANVITETLLKLQLSHQIQLSQQSQLVAINIHIDTVNEYSLLSDNEYQRMIDKASVAKYVYLFAQRIQAAVVETTPSDFLLISTRCSLDAETHSLENLNLACEIAQNTVYTVSIGIGFGKTTLAARHGADLGMARAVRSGGNAAFVVDEAQRSINPLNCQDREKSDIPRIDNKFLRISEQVGVSVNTIFRLYSVIQTQGQTNFTIAELSRLLQVTPRTASRIVNKLEDSGFCRETGKRILAGTGRPCRILEISL